MPQPNQQNVALGIMRTSRSLLDIAIALLQGEHPTALNPESLKVAIAMMEGGVAPEPQIEGAEEKAEINPGWFKGKNKHMTILGIKYIRGLWLNKVDVPTAAELMGIDWKSANARYAQFEAGKYSDL